MYFFLGKESSELRDSFPVNMRGSECMRVHLHSQSSLTRTKREKRLERMTSRLSRNKDTTGVLREEVVQVAVKEKRED
jgi:hypothetical protein